MNNTILGAESAWVRVRIARSSGTSTCATVPTVREALVRPLRRERIQCREFPVRSTAGPINRTESLFVNRIFKFMVLVLLMPMLAAADDYDQVRERLSTLVDGEIDISIAESPLPGILQVRLGSDIVYMTSDGRYLLQGRVLDLDTRQDITDQAKSQIRQELIDGIDYDQLISYGAEDSEFEIIVFTDVDCGYCRRLHQQVEEYNDAGIRINYAAFPRAGTGSETFRKMTSVWCSDDKQAAMDLAKGGGTPEPAECDAPVSEQYQLGQAVGVTGTPALITPGGDLIPGYVPPNDLRVRLEQLAAKEDTAAPQDAEAE